MGDAGSTLLGFAIVWITIGISQGSERTISPVHCLWFAALPIFDFFTCFVQRIVRGKTPFTPGRDHMHHILQRGGFSVQQRLAILVGMQSFYSMVGIAGHYSGAPDVLMFAAWSLLGLSQAAILRQVSKRHRLRFKIRR
jgi:UDP-GlcNAc:undecaprenyl-phosphate GlcNAc-1-phosphate transferase